MEDLSQKNQLAVLAAIREIRTLLEQRSGAVSVEPAVLEKAPRKSSRKPVRQIVEIPSEAAEANALEKLVRRFRLSSFERRVVVLCLGMEMDAELARLCGRLQGGQRFVTFGFALSALPEAHWDAITPVGKLRRWRLIEVDTSSGVTTAPLRIDERILHFVTGIPYLDPRLRGLVTRVESTAELSPGQTLQAQKVVDAIARAQSTGEAPIFDLRGNDPAARAPLAAAAAAACSLKLFQIRASDLPALPEERAALAPLWDREAALSESALLIAISDEDSAEISQRGQALARSLRGIVFVAGPHALAAGKRRILEIAVAAPNLEEQISIWTQKLGAQAPRLNGQIARVAAQFSLDVRGIHSAADDFASRSSGAKAADSSAGAHLWSAAREQSRVSLDHLAQRLQATASWEDLVLPAPQLQTLRTMVAQVRQRNRVCDTWGFARKSTRGLGLSTLFSGPSGTGKTMAAEVLARELELDLFRVDLSGMVSKYIGETEKNLKKVFDAADRSGAILLFDEADALFGKRSEVRDSHDRYANIEVSYLLQRVEAYRGLAILTTNMKQALDSAFLRRLRFVVPFPFPDTAQRREIWRRIFPAETPVEKLDFDQLAKLSLAGGHIRNVALNAAFLAAEGGERVGMRHLQIAAQSEYAKLEKTATEPETRNWS